jgi:hypothetical protein
MTTAQISMGTSNRASRKPRPLRIPAQQPSTDGGSNATSAEAFLHNRGAPHGASSGRWIPRHRRGIRTCRVGRWVHRHAGRCTSHVGLSCEAFWSLGGDSPRLVCFASRGCRLDEDRPRSEESRAAPLGEVPLDRVTFDGVSAWVTGMVAEGCRASRTQQVHHLLTSMLDDAVTD